MSGYPVESHAEVVVDLNQKKPIRVLHVDDELGFLKIAKQCLEMQGAFQVDTASSAEEAMKKIKKETYDAIVSDYQMPGKDGLQFLRELRANRNSIPFIIFTGKGREEVAIEALNLGADQYLNKTGDPATVYCELAHGIQQAVEKNKTEEELRRFSGAVKSSLDGIIICDANGRIIDVNDAITRTYGSTDERELIGKNSLDLLAPEELDRAMKNLKQLLQEGGIRRGEYTAITKSGRRIPAEISVTLLEDSESKPTGIVSIIRDITERKKAEENLRESERKYREIFENANDVIVYVDKRGKIIDLNARVKETFGYDRAELVGKNVFDSGLVGSKHLSQLIEVFKDSVSKGEVLATADDRINRMEIEMKHKRGHTIIVEASTQVIAENGNLEGFLSVLREITGRKKAEDALRRSERKYREFADSLPEIAFEIDEKGDVAFFNRRASEILGYSQEEFRSMGIFQFLIPEDRVRVKENIQAILKGEKSRSSEYTLLKKDGGTIPVLAFSNRVINEDGKVGVRGIIIDISEQKDTEEKLREREETLSALNTHSLKLNMAESMEEIYRLTMDAVEKTLGFEIAFFMVVDKNMLRVVDHRGYPQSFSMQLPLDGTKRGVTVKAAKIGRTVNVPDAEKEDDWVEFMPGIRSAMDVPVKIGNDTLGVIGVDSKELNAFDEKDQELVEILASHAATAMCNLDRAKKLEVYTRDLEESQQTLERLFMDNPEATVHLDSSFRILNVNPRFTRLFGYPLDEIKGKRINDVVVQEGKMEEAEMLDKKAINGYVYHDTLRRRKDGSLVPVSISAAPVAVEGQLLGYVGMYKDISELKNAEKKLEAMNEKLRVVGGLTRHDVRNKLSTITGNIYLNKKKLADHPEILAGFKDMESACEQIVRVFNFAKDYEMLGAEELKYIETEKVVNEAVSLFPNLDGVKITNGCRGLTVLADSLLRQLFYNLIDNSLKHGEKLSQIRIRYEKTEENQLRLVYEDDGVGIAWNAKPKIFGESYTTGKGSGYGLYLVKRMIEVYGWGIRETGSPGKGACFTIAIPETNQDGRENYRLG
jgi:PAS domain S-box-containing protein